jgi:hypothetical protein
LGDKGITILLMVDLLLPRLILDFKGEYCEELGEKACFVTAKEDVFWNPI